MLKVKLNAGQLKRGRMIENLRKEDIEKILKCQTYRDIKKYLSHEVYKEYLTTNDFTMNDRVDISTADYKNKIIFITWINRGCFYTATLTITNNTYSEAL